MSIQKYLHIHRWLSISPIAAFHSSQLLLYPSVLLGSDKAQPLDPAISDFLDSLVISEVEDEDSGEECGRGLGLAVVDGGITKEGFDAEALIEF